MFSGEYEHTIDNKGRLIVPSKFREQLGAKFMITRGFDGCLFVYPNEEWHHIEESFTAQPMVTREKRRFMRSFFSNAAECEVDKQGRILIPAKLREYAAIDKDVVSIGVLKRVEIWSKERYDTEMDGYDDIDDFADQMEEMGITL